MDTWSRQSSPSDRETPCRHRLRKQSAESRQRLRARRSSASSSRWQILAKVHDSSRFLEAQRAMGSMAGFVVDDRIRSKLRTPLLDAPPFGSRNERGANTVPPE